MTLTGPGSGAVSRLWPARADVSVDRRERGHVRDNEPPVGATSPDRQSAVLLAACSASRPVYRRAMAGPPLWREPPTCGTDRRGCLTTAMQGCPDRLVAHAELATQRPQASGGGEGAEG